MTQTWYDLWEKREKKKEILAVPVVKALPLQNKNASQFWWNSPLMPKTSETQANAHPLGSIMALSSIALFVVL